MFSFIFFKVSYIQKCSFHYSNQKIWIFHREFENAAFEKEQRMLGKKRPVKSLVPFLFEPINFQFHLPYFYARLQVKI